MCNVSIGLGDAAQVRRMQVASSCGMTVSYLLLHFSESFDYNYGRLRVVLIDLEPNSRGSLSSSLDEKDDHMG